MALHGINSIVETPSPTEHYIIPYRAVPVLRWRISPNAAKGVLNISKMPKQFTPKVKLSEGLLHHVHKNNRGCAFG